MKILKKFPPLWLPLSEVKFDYLCNNTVRLITHAKTATDVAVLRLEN